MAHMADVCLADCKYDCQNYHEEDSQDNSDFQWIWDVVECSPVDNEVADEESEHPVKCSGCTDRHLHIRKN